MVRLEPVHPGEILKYDLMDPWGLSATALPTALGVSPGRITEIVRGRRSITASTAVRFARYFRTDPQSWMNLQTRYELLVAARTAGRALQAVSTPCQHRKTLPPPEPHRLLSRKRGDMR